MERFQKYEPHQWLRPYVKAFFISENPSAETYNVLPVPAIVLGFQYSGALTYIGETKETNLSQAGLTGFTDKFRTYRTTAGIGTVLVYFTETGLSHFTDCPAFNLFGESVALDNLFCKNSVANITDSLGHARTDLERITIVEQFLLSEIKSEKVDSMLNEAVYHIYQTKGAMRVSELRKRVNTSASVLERRFKNEIGITPKKFASIVRFNNTLEELKGDGSLTEIFYRSNYFDQAHFIKDFKSFTGLPPEEFRRLL